MTTFLIYLTPSFKAEASTTIREENHLITEIDCSTADLMNVLDIAQRTVDATLTQLDNQRIHLMVNSPNDKGIN
jgi:hypothetical protein